MKSREIPRNEWLSFLEGFASQHQGWLVNLDRRQQSNGRVAVLYERPLDHIHVDTKGNGRIALVFGRPDGEQVTEVVEAPTRIRFLETTPGAHAGLEIESVDGTALVMRFRSAMPPEMVDGIAA
jgi:hypothetical protein